MRNIAGRLALVAAAAALAAPCAFGIAASQEWVRQYVAGLNGGTNDTFTATTPGGTKITMTYELFTEAALMATNSANATVTNGTLFAWNGEGRYLNLNVPPGLTIQATTTNFIFGAAQSRVVDEIDTFVDADGGAFGVVARPITKSEADRLKGE